ncbi:sialidase [Sphingobacterium phlebotomi]|uniref:Sialidase n=1 Tax=Sphingobacterium phlebotomi TaxID=2605433 RepID=A0A5D4H5H5_9SPHI|nr:sialidase family protein [Sphingobacterium phlebotomi]TYR35754.1 sialidase [Sphingobacterium phlebotomi]
MSSNKLTNLWWFRMMAIALFLFNSLLNAQTRPEKMVKHQAGIILEEFLFMEADFPSCHSATIVELPNKELLCTYFGGTYERHPDVEIRLQRKKLDGTWTSPISVADGVQPDGERFPTWNPVLFQPRGEDLVLYFKVGPSPKEWWGEFITSNDNGHTWSKPQRLEGELLGPIKNKPIQLLDGTILSGSSNENGGWKAHLERSTDGGRSWSFIGPLNDGKKMAAIQPTLLTHTDGSIQMLSRTNTNGAERITETWSKDGGLTWSEMTWTTLPNNNSGLDGVTLKDGRHLLVYNHSTREQEGMGHKGRGVLNLAISKDGKKWDAALMLDYIDEPEKQYSYPSIIQTSDGLVHIVYTWHRERIKHVVVDPDQLITFPIVDGQWPFKDIPLVTSTEQ